MFKSIEAATNRIANEKLLPTDLDLNRFGSQLSTLSNAWTRAGTGPPPAGMNFLPGCVALFNVGILKVRIIFSVLEILNHIRVAFGFRLQRLHS